MVARENGEKRAREEIFIFHARKFGFTVREKSTFLVAILETKRSIIVCCVFFIFRMTSALFYLLNADTTAHIISIFESYLLVS